MDKNALFTQGLSTYWDARYAIRNFEDTIKITANEILNANLEELNKAFGLNEARKTWLEANPDVYLGQMAVGAAYEWESGLRLGLGWRPSNDDATAIQAVACVTFRMSAQYKRDNLFGALKKASLASQRDLISMSESREGPHEISIWSPFFPGAGIEDMRTLLSQVINAAIEWRKASGV